MCKEKNNQDIPIIATLILLTLGLILFFRSEKPLTIAEGAEYWASIAAAGALVWLVVGHWQQSKAIQTQVENLDLQREQISLYKQELVNQRTELKLQRAELTKMNYSSSLMHIKEMMDTARKDYEGNEINSTVGYMDEHLGPALESDDPAVVTAHTEAWFKKYQPYIMFVKRIKDAAEFYFTMNNVTYNKDHTYTDVFLYVNAPLFAKVPYLSECYNSATLQIKINAALNDVPELMIFASFSAQYIKTPRFINVDVMETIASKIGEKLWPTIYKKMLQLEKKNRGKT